MLRTIPKRILTHSVTLKVPLTVDAYGALTYTPYTLTAVHVQPTHAIRKSTQDKEVILNAIMFYDARLSQPSIDWVSLQIASDALNAQMKVAFGGFEYTVAGIDILPDDEGNLHHVEVSLV